MQWFKGWVIITVSFYFLLVTATKNIKKLHYYEFWLFYILEDTSSGDLSMCKADARKSEDDSAKIDPDGSRIFSNYYLFL